MGSDMLQVAEAIRLGCNLVVAYGEPSSVQASRKAPLANLNMHSNRRYMSPI